MFIVDEENRIFSISEQSLISLFEKVEKKFTRKKIQKIMTRLRGGRPRKQISDKELREKAKRMLGYRN